MPAEPGRRAIKIAIYGAGAIGGYLGVELSLAGNDVTLIARGPHLAAMKAKGLKLLIDGEERVARDCLCTDDPEEAGPQDYVIIGLKAHQAYDAAGRFGPLLGPKTAVVTAMNGVPWWYFYQLDGPYRNHRLESVDPGGWQWKTIGPERAIGCVVYPAAVITEPGVIKHVYGNKFTLGEPDGRISTRSKKLSAEMEKAGFKAPVRDNIRDDIWIKLWGNLCFNPISALTGATLDIVATDTATRILSRCMMIEAQAIGEALGAHFRVDVHRRINGAAEVGPHKTSMLQDMEKGRAMEIDALVTAVQEMSRLVDIETPYIDTVLGLIQQRGRMLGLYPTFAGPDLGSDAGEDERHLVD
jgi:2-dehydropantoate 2-reductase